MSGDRLRAAVRGLASSAVAGLFAVAVLAAGARWWLPQTLHGPVAEGAWTARSRALFTPTGFFRPEFDAGAARHFSWSGESSELTFSGLNRSIAYRVSLEIRGGRPEGIQPAYLRASVDGRVRADATVIGPTSRLEFEIPRADHDGAVVALAVIPTYTPGGSDPRALGVIVDDVALTPVNGAFRPGTAALGKTLAAVMALAFGLWVAGLRGILFWVTSILTATGFAWLLIQDAAFSGAYVDRVLRIGLAAGGIGLIAGALGVKWPSIGGVPEWTTAAGLVLAAAAVKLALFWHPLAIVGDGMFQVHRAQLVHAGQYFFTSVTPRPFFEFPYPVALYVAAQPFWNWFPAELDLVRLLRAVALVADALVGLALYGAARRLWPNRVALFAAALWPFARAPFEALTNANLTNLFGQGVFGVALAGIAWLAASSAISWPALALIGVLLVVAFLSHFGTLTVGLVMLGAVAGALIAMGRGHARRVGLWVAALTIAAAAVSWLLYYSHPAFMDVYKKSYASVSAQAQDDSSKIVAAPAVKFQRWWSGVGDDYGRPGVTVLIAALAGAWLVLRRHRRSPVVLVFGAWIAAWLALSALGIFSAFTLRANLATAPAFVFLAAVTLGAIAERSRGGPIVAAAIFMLLAWDGWQIGLRCLALSGAG